MYRKTKLTIGILLTVLVLFIIGYYGSFYPVCSMQVVDNVFVTTPPANVGPRAVDYKNDCLHPCIRYFENGFLGYKYWMVQSPYYAKNNQIETPILYKSNDYMQWKNGVEVAQTPEKGYNSDPCLFYEDSVLYIFGESV